MQKKYLVATRAASLGFSHGVAAAAGVVLGDLFFGALAVFGLVALAAVMGEWFMWVKYAAGLYLIWLGVQLWRQASGGTAQHEAAGGSVLGSAAAGFLLTLSDQKAVLFYFAFLPAFVELAALSWREVALIVAITVTAVGGVKVMYAYAAARGGRMFSTEWGMRFNRGAGAMLTLAGTVLLVRA